MITFNLSDLPNMASHCHQDVCGFSLHRGVLVQWDEDHDERVIGVLDQMPISVIERLIAVQEHEGCISFVWSGSVPCGYEDDGEGITAPDGDWWCIQSSVALKNITPNTTIQP